MAILRNLKAESMLEAPVIVLFSGSKIQIHPVITFVIKAGAYNPIPLK
jgi:hypothetical protein